MDKINQYKSIIQKELKCQASYSNSDMPNVHSQAIVSEDGNHFILLILGWNGKHYHHQLAFHIEIKNGLVWIHEDKTDTGIALNLEENGIPSSDIILGFAQPYEMTDKVEVN